MEFRVLGPLEVLGDGGEPVTLGGKAPTRAARAPAAPPQRSGLDRPADRRGVGRESARQRPRRAPGARPRPPQGARRRPDRDAPARLPRSASSRRRAGRRPLRAARRRRALRGGARALARPGARRRRRRAVRGPRRGAPRRSAARGGRGPDRLGARRGRARRRRRRARRARRRPPPPRAAAGAADARPLPRRPAGGRPRRVPRRTRARWTSSASSRPPSCARSSSGSCGRTPTSRRPRPPARSARPSGALPAARTPLVGRDLEVAAVRALLGRPDTRLVTLTGPGRHGQDAARARRRGSAAARAVFVDLVGRRRRAARPPHDRARSLGAGEAPGEDDARDRRSRRSAATRRCSCSTTSSRCWTRRPDVAALVAAAPAVAVLVTSRAPLRVAAEHVYARAAAPRARARETRPRGDRARRPRCGSTPSARGPRSADFELTDANAAAVARICRALDGLPLALELAAARVRSLGPEGTADRLGERLSLLSRGARDLPERQRSLRATLDWSVQLPRRRAHATLLAVLGAFSGGASLGALELVAGRRRGRRPRSRSCSTRARRAARRTSETPRFGMLETVREYAAELLAASGEEREIRDRHLDWLLALVEGEGLYWQRLMDAAWLDRVELEHDNIRAAFAYARGGGRRRARAPPRDRDAVLLARARVRRGGPAPARARRRARSDRRRRAQARRSARRG